MVIGYEVTEFTVSEAVDTVELCVSFRTPPTLDQVQDLEVFIRAETTRGTASMLRLTITVFMANAIAPWA